MDGFADRQGGAADTSSPACRRPSTVHAIPRTRWSPCRERVAAPRRFSVCSLTRRPSQCTVVNSPFTDRRFPFCVRAR